MSNLIKFHVTTPGKVILHGEYSVVYGKPALAGVIGLRNTLRFQEISDNKIVINFHKFNKIFELNFEKINKFYKINFEKYQNEKLPENIGHENFFQSVKEFLKIECKLNEIDMKILNGLSAVLYLMIGIFIDQQLNEIKNGFSIEIDTEMSIGAGLGSSASFGVCLASGFYFYSRLYNNNYYKENKLTNLSISLSEKIPDWLTKDEKVREYISTWAFCSEKIMHGNPSGLDNTICTFGKIVKFYRGSPPENVSLKNPLNILIVDTGVDRSTAKQVEKFSTLKEKFPKLIDDILNAMGQLVEDATAILENYDSGEYDKLKTLVSINNNLLRSIGTSHESLEKIFAIAEKYDFAAKLTGAGGGGYATILLPANYKKNDNFQKLCDQLTIENFSWKETTIGGDGVILYFE